MSDYFFRGRNVDGLTRDELIILVKWLIHRLDEKRYHQDNWMDALKSIWRDDDQ